MFPERLVFLRQSQMLHFFFGYASYRWVLIAEDEVLMTWGKTSKVYVYEKLPEKKSKTN
jgi:hypothetical protein